MPTRWRVAASAIPLAFQAACITSWEQQAVPPAPAMTAITDPEVRVVLANGSKVVLRDPTVKHDSVVGWVSPPWDSAGGAVRHAYDLASVRHVEVKKNDVGPNIVLGVVAGTALFFVAVMGAWAISCATQYCD